MFAQLNTARCIVRILLALRC